MLRGRIPGRLTFVGMVAVAFVLAHDLIFIAAYGSGYQAALLRTGHGAVWEPAVLSVLVLGASLLAIALWRLHRLGILARSADRTSLAPALRSVPGRVARLWLWLTTSTIVLFVLEENVERARMGAALPGLGVLASSAYPNALLTIAIVSFSVALVGALIRWRRDILVARLNTGRRRWPTVRGETPRPWPRRSPLWHGSILGRSLAGRAPPPRGEARIRPLTGTQ